MSTNYNPISTVKECGRIFCTTFLSLVPPLSLLLFAQLSAARHQTVHQKPHNSVSTFLHTNTTSLLGFLVLAAAADALLQGFTGEERAWLISGRRRLHAAVVWVFSMQVCLSLWIYGFVEVDDGRIGGGGACSLVMGLGLHEAVVFWRRYVVKPAVEEAVSGLRGEGFSWGENVLLAAALGCLWWRRLRGEAEEQLLAMGRDMEAVDVVGWLLYCSTAAVGGVRVVKGLLWVVNGIFRCHQPVNGEDDNSLGLTIKIETEYEM
ncbi:hypothetical protein AAHA92_08831 [Salvia divinorum]|uniref:Uncharacterized protein n=1 Tax=Salvia divinorum TaxID=28513 RepID=A0ABD1HPH5_SALDI